MKNATSKIRHYVGYYFCYAFFFNICKPAKNKSNVSYSRIDGNLNTNKTLCEDDCLPGCCAVLSGGSLLAFQNCLLSPSSGR